MAHDDNKPSTSTHARSNSNGISSAITKNFDSRVTISIEDKRPSRGDNTNGHRLENSESPVLGSHLKTLSSKVPRRKVSGKLVIDRGSKPTALNTYDPRCTVVLKWLKKLHKLAIAKAALADELYDQEYKLYSEREEKYSASDKKYLCGEIKRLKANFEVVHNLYLSNENEYEAYLNKAGTIKFDIHNCEKKDLELALSLANKEIKDTETKIKKLHDEFLQRKNKKTKQIDSDVHKEPLRTYGASINISLKRSYSSPNLLQLGDHKRPRIDEVSSRSENQEEQVTPVHGNVQLQQPQQEQQAEQQQEQQEEQQQEPPDKRARHNVRRPGKRGGRKARARRNARRTAEWMARKLRSRGQLSVVM